MEQASAAVIWRAFPWAEAATWQTWVRRIQAAFMREDIADKIARFNTVCRSRNPDRGIPHYALEHEASCCWTKVSYAQTLNYDKKIANSHNPTEKCSCSS